MKHVFHAAQFALEIFSNMEHTQWFCRQRLSVKHAILFVNFENTTTTSKSERLYIHSTKMYILIPNLLSVGKSIKSSFIT